MKSYLHIRKREYYPYREKPPFGLKNKDLAWIRILKICGNDYRKRVYIAASIRAQNVIEERKIQVRDILQARKDLETLSTASIE